MITALDHIALAVPDLAAACADYSAVLGLRPTSSCDHAAAPAVCRLQTENIAMVLEPMTDRGGATVRLAFAVADVAAAAHRLSRRGLPGQAGSREHTYLIDRGATHGVVIGLVGAAASASEAGGGDILGLDHVVIRSPDPERAVALYGGRFGLDLRLDRTNEAIGNRLLFFVCGDLVVEISHDTRKGVQVGEDRIAGFAWRAADIEGAHRRMTSAGVTVSEIRPGRRPGTRVFTVKSHTCGVPTLVIGGDGLKRA